MQILQQLHEILGQPLRHEPDIEAYLRSHYPPSYREVMDAEQEMARSQHARTAFTDAEGSLIGLNLYQCELSDDQADALLKLDLPQLRVLNLARNPLSRFTLSARMPALEILALNHNESLHTLRCEDGLAQLRRLDAAFCALKQFRVPASYTSLEFLRLDGNKPLEELRFDGPCPRLQVLMLRGCALKAFRLPAGFDSLLHLYLNQNQIETLELAGELPELRTLQVRGNRLEALPFSLIRYKKLEGLYVGENPLSAIPKGIITKEKDQSSLSEVLSYLRESAKGKRPNERVKLVLVGNGRTGKTSLYRRLKGEPFNPREKFTHGVQLGQLDKQHLPDVRTDSLELQVWDFGGQEIFYATHQFFLNDNALYLLTWTDPAYVEEARKQIESDFPDEAWRSREYWLENIRHHAPGSPILMVQTFADKRKIPIDEAGYYEQPYRAVCLTFDASNDTGLAELRRELGRKLNEELDFLGMPIASTYLDAVVGISEIAAEKRRSAERPVVSWSDFEAICRRIGLEPGEENARNLCRYLHHAGALVYFGDDARFPSLRDLIFIDPDWLTKQVYRLINPALALCRYPLTQALWREVMGSDPENLYFTGSERPVEQVSWDDCQQFIIQLNARTGQHYRLPTEAEWEYAARGGRYGQGFEYSGSADLDEVGWHGDNSYGETLPVGLRQPNALGLYDLSGNVWEWCQDWYGDYPSGPHTNPSGSKDSSGRVRRGGGWSNGPVGVRVSRRFDWNSGLRFLDLGFRLARSL
jgi:Leucine-rich repeat (LRR) protein